MKINRILCPVDFSIFNETANQFASEIAQSSGADITYMHVTAPEVPYGSVKSEDLERQRNHEQHELEKVSPTAAGIDTHHVVEFGSPAQRIVEYAKENEIDLIVMSTHGRTGFRKILMGSVTESVVQKSDCPVLVVKSGTQETTQCFDSAEVGRPRTGSSPQANKSTFANNSSVICAIDVGDFNQDIVDLAATFAKRDHADLDLVHVTDSPDPLATAWPGYIASPNELSLDHRQLLEIKTDVAGINLHYHHLSGSPTAKILDFVARNDARLLVVGTKGRSGVSRFLGSVANVLLRDAPCPVMVLRQRQSSRLEKTTVS